MSLPVLLLTTVVVVPLAGFLWYVFVPSRAVRERNAELRANFRIGRARAMEKHRQHVEKCRAEGHQPEPFAVFAPLWATREEKIVAGQTTGFTVQIAEGRD